MTSHLHSSSTPPRSPVSPSIPVSQLSPARANRPPPINADKHSLPTQPPFAELLTPQKLRHRHRHPSTQPLPPPAFLQPGPSNQGFYTIDGDLFRGAAVDPSRRPTVEDNEDAITFSGSSISSSSTNGLKRGRRATMAVLERFGTAFGVRRGSSSSGSTRTASDVERRSRRLSRADSKESSSPKRSKREHLPKKREFILLLPPVKDPSTSATPRDSLPSDDTRVPIVYPSDRVIVTPSLPIVVDHIRNLRSASGMLPDVADAQMSRGGSGSGRPRPKMPQGAASFVSPPVPTRPTKSRLHTLREVPVRPKSVSDIMGLANPYDSTPSSGALRSNELLTPLRAGTPLTGSSKEERNGKGKEKGCWWLDVACPGWEDLRDLGELLSLHPLTLEDVLHQDPREKLDMFETLGYYFVVIRALDEGYFKYTPGSANSSASGLASTRVPSAELKAAPLGRETSRRSWGMGRASGKNATKGEEKVEIVEENPGKEGLEGVGVGAVNVYLAVFADGIISFHFEDISKHTKRVLGRLLSLANENHSSDWIAHGLLDSIVDAFFPLIRFVDNEVDEIDSLSIDPSINPRSISSSIDASSVSSAIDPAEDIVMSEKLVCDEKPLKACRATSPTPPNPQISWRVRAKAHLPVIRLPLALVYLRLFFLPTSSAVKRKYEAQPKHVSERSTMLKRITDTRRLVTGLSRLLGAKHQVIGRLRKRGAETGGGVEAYIGDVEDHVLLIQTSLYHYEYILSNCQPAYLSQLSLSFSFARGGTDQAILALSTVTISVLPMQLIIGMLSMNIHGPRNGDQADSTHREPDGSIAPFNYFAGTVVVIFLAACCMLSLIRYWRWTARKKFAGFRNVELPDAWKGYWGWE